MGSSFGVISQTGNNIQTEGLVFYVDASINKSYPKSGANTFNLASGSLTPTGSLKNDTVYQSNGGGSWFFDNVDDFINCGNPSILNFGNGSSDNPFSISTWINMTDATNFVPIAKDTSGDRQWVIRFVSDKLHFYTIDDSAGGYIGRLYNTAITSFQGTWIHTAYTYDASEANSGFKIYLNGIRVDDTNYSAGSYTAMEATTQPVQIGAQGSFIDSSYGYIANCQVYNRALSAGDVLQNYNAQKGRFGL